jgi:hypothetical protein
MTNPQPGLHITYLSLSLKYVILIVQTFNKIQNKNTAVTEMFAGLCAQYK